MVISKALKNIFDLYIKSSVHVALAVVAFAGITMLEFGIAFDMDLLLFIFFGTVTGYNFIKYAQIAKLHHRSLTNNLRIIQIFSLFSFIALVYFGWQQSWAVLIASAIFGLLTLLYALPILPDQKNLRSISGIKIFIIAFVWAGISVILPVLTQDTIFVYSSVITFVQRCLFVIALTLPFDIRDLRLDQNNLGTIPQVFGVQKTRSMGALLLSGVVILEVVKIELTIAEIAILLFIVAVTYFAIKKSTHKQSKYFASFWIEAIPILWFALLYIAELAFNGM